MQESTFRPKDPLEAVAAGPLAALETGLLPGMDLDQGSGSVAMLLKQVDPVSPVTRCGDVYDIFSGDPQLHSLPVVEALKPVGLINRRALVEQYSKLYFRDLYGKKPISLIMEKSPLVVDKGVSLDDVSRILVEDGDQFLYDGFIITEQGSYLGMGRAHDLMAELAKRKQAHLFHIAHHDVLTGLPNRQLFRDRLRKSLARAERHGHRVGLLFIDLDHFKSVNDTLGHPAGDELLLAVAGRLKGCVRSADTVARLGGDEFTVILDEMNSVGDASVVSEKILWALSQPLEIKGRVLHISASVGVSLYPEDGSDADTLVSRSDNALYHAKERRNSFQFFQKNVHDELMRRHAMDAELRGALEKGEMELYYQPKLDLKSGRICGAEALLRWEHPFRGLVGPSEFIPLAESNGMIIALGDWALAQACRQAASWQAEGFPNFSMAVNVSARQLERPGLAEAVLRVLTETGLAPELIELELTESVAMNSKGRASEELDLLRSCGVRIAMDDFGTGYSSLAYLRNFSFDTLKIDRSFVISLVKSPRDQAIARAILAMAHSLDLTVVAEGVETYEQRELLKADGCDVMQGYACSPPLPAAEMGGLLRAAAYDCGRLIDTA